MQRNAYKKDRALLGRLLNKLVKSCWGLQYSYPTDGAHAETARALVGMLGEM